MYLICKLTKQHDSCSNPLPEVCESLVAESAVNDSDPCVADTYSLNSIAILV